MIASYKKNTEGRDHRHNRMDCNVAQRARRDCFYDASWAEYYTQPRIPEGAVHLIVGDSLIRVLTRIQSHTADVGITRESSRTPSWSRNAADVGITRDGRDGLYVHSDPNDGDQ